MSEEVSNTTRARLDALRRYNLLDSGHRADFDKIVMLAAQLCDTPMAAFSINDVSRQRFLSCYGFSLERVPLEKDFAQIVVSDRSSLLVNNVKIDHRFRHAPMTKALDDLCFYAGVPVINPDGVALGTLAVMDTVSRHLPPNKLSALATLANQLITHVELERRLQSPHTAVITSGYDGTVIDFHGLFDALPGVFWVIEPDEFRLVAISNDFLRVTGTVREMVIGKRLFDVFPGDPNDRNGVNTLRESLERVKLLGRSDVITMMRYPLVRPASAGGGLEERYWNTVSTPVFDAGRQLRYIIHHTEDITEIVKGAGKDEPTMDRRVLQMRVKRMEDELLQHTRELERLNNHLAMAQRVARIGSWQFRIADGARQWSDEVYRIIGLSRDEFPEGDDAVRAAVHPDDREFLAAARADAMRGDGPMEVTHRIVRPDGEVRHVQERARLLRDNDGNPLLLYGTIQDITEQRLAEAEIIARAQRQEAVANFGQHALGDVSIDDLHREAVAVIREKLDVDQSGIFRLSHDGRSLLLVEGVGWKEGVIGETVFDVPPDSRTAQALRTGNPVVIENTRTNGSWENAPLLREHAVASSIGAVIAGKDSPWGILAANSSLPRKFSPDEVHFVQSIANVLAEATQRMQVGKELQSRMRQQAAVSALGREALRNPDLHHLQQMATEQVAQTFDVDFCKLLELLPDGSGLKLVAGVGWKDGLVGHAILGTGKSSHGGYTIEAGKPVIVDDFVTETRFREPLMLREHGVVSGISVVIAGEHGPWGVLGAHTTQRRRFTGTDVHFFQSMANVLAEVTQRAAIDTAIRDSEQRTRQIIDTALDAVISIDTKSVITDWNPQAELIFGWSREEAIGKLLHELVMPERYRDAHLRGMRHFIETGEGPLIERRVELAALHRSGREFPIELAVSSVHSVGGRKFSAFVRDITERRKHEASLRISEERFRIVARATIDTIWDWNLLTDEVWWNEGMYNVFGYNKDDLEPDSSSWINRVHPDDRDRAIDSAQQVIRGGGENWQESYRFRRKNGSYAHVKVRGFVVRDVSGKALRIVGGMDDVTQQMEYEARLAQQAELLDKAQDAIVVCDMENRITYWNRSAERLYGWTAEEALGTSVDTMFYKDSTTYRDAMRTLFETDEWIGEIEQRRKDGTLITVEGAWSLVRDKEGRPQSILAINTDITERLALEEQLRQSQRLESIGKLTGGVAHDFNNLLTVILGNAELMTEQLPPDNRMHRLATMTKTAAQRGADLTHRLLAFARRQALEPKTTDINQLVLGMEDLLQRTLLENIDVEVISTDDLWRAYIDRSQLESVLLNLAINAKDAMSGGGRLTIETANVQIDSDYADHHADVIPGRYVMIAVSDTGEGIPPEIIDHVFDPFFTTKEKGKGTGLGLSMAYGFVKQSRGHIKIYSEPGQGTTVKLYLPRAERAGDVVEVQAPAEQDFTGSEKVLIVEDDELVRQHAQSQLAEFGYKVTTARNGPEAMEIIKEREDIDLLFTDVIMSGGMNGRDLAEMAKRLRPKLKILYTSGYTENAIMHHGRLDPGVHLLQKPYRRADLAKKVRAALSDKSVDERAGRQQ